MNKKLDEATRLLIDSLPESLKDKVNVSHCASVKYY